MSQHITPDKAVESLSPAHRHMLEVASGLSPDVIAARHYRSITAEEAAKLGYSPMQCRSGLFIPGYGPDGVNGRSQLRPDQPRPGTNGKPIKYESPLGSRPYLDVHPSMTHLLSDPSVTLWLTEGIKKGDRATTERLLCIALQGVWSWRLLAEWALVELKGREIRIAFDSDVIDKKEVRHAMMMLAAFLISQGARVRIVRLPPEADGTKVGLDDFLAAGGTVADLDALTGPVLTLADLADDAPNAIAIDERTARRQAFRDARERHLRQRHLELLRRDRAIRRLVKDGAINDGDKIAALQMAEETEEWAQRPAPAGPRRMYMETTAKKYGVARATWSSRVDALAEKYGVLEVVRRDRISPVTDPATGRPVIDQKTGRIKKSYDTAVMVTPRTSGADLLAAIVDRTFAPDVPRERVKKKARGPSCRTHPHATLIVETVTTWRCPDCPADENLIAERVRTREPKRATPLSNFDSPLSSADETPADVSDLDANTPLYRRQDLTASLTGHDPAWRPGMPTFVVRESTIAPLSNFDTPRVDVCSDCGTAPPVPYHPRCQACIMARIPAPSSRTGPPPLRAQPRLEVLLEVAS